MVIQKGLSPRTLSVDSEIDKEPFKTQRNLFSFFLLLIVSSKNSEFCFFFFSTPFLSELLKSLTEGFVIL